MPVTCAGAPPCVTSWRRIALIASRTASGASLLSERAVNVRCFGSDADMAVNPLGIAVEIDARSRPHAAALLDHIMPVGEALEHAEILVDHQNRLSLLL